MGNQPSTNTSSISNFSFDALILDSVLNDVPTDNINLSVQKIKNLKINDSSLVADKIFEKGISHHYCSDKYAQLAKKFCEEISQNGAEWNLLDYINRKAHYYLEVLHECVENGRPISHDRIYGISVFIGNLYNFELLSSEKIFLWILNDAYPVAHDVRKHILMTIKNKVLKVTDDQTEVCSDPFVWELLDSLNKEGVIRTKLVTKPTFRLPLERAQEANEPSSSSSTTTDSPIRTNFKPPTVNIPVAFEQHLKSLLSPPLKAFDIQLFKTCSENDRKESALRMLKCALTDQRQAPKLAKLALSILQLNMKTTTTKKSFTNYLTDACDKQLEKNCDTTKINWTEVENFGIFLAELYNLEVLRIYITNTWLDKTRIIAENNSFALKMLFEVFKIIYPKMKLKDPRTLGIYLKHFERYKSLGKIPVAYISWYNTALSASKHRDRSSSVVSSTSESSQGSKRSEQLSTGAIRKQTNILVEVSETTKICSEFTNFLAELKSKSSTNFTINFDTASDAAIRGCALLLIEHSLLNDGQFGKLAHVTKYTIMKNIKKADRLKVFSANFSLYIYAEMTKFLKTEDPTASDWKKVEKLGRYISELYKQDIVEGTMVKAWLSKLEFTATIGSEEAATEFFATFKKVGDKLKRDFPEEYEQYVQFSNREIPKQPIKTTKVVSVKSSSEKLSILMSNDMRDFNYILNNLSTTTPEKLNAAIDKLEVNDREKMEMLVQIYFEAYKSHNGNPVYAHLAKSINDQISLPACSFKNLLIAMVIGEFNNVSICMRTKAEKQCVEIHARCIGELYSIGWLDESILIACLDMLCGNNFENVNHIQAFRNFIKNIALNIANNGHGECCQKYYKILSARQSNFLEAFNEFVCDETLEILESIWNMTKMRKKHNIDEIYFEEVLKKLTIENIAISSSRINISTVGCKEDLMEMVNVFIKTCVQNPDNTSTYVQFLSEIKEIKVDLIDGSTIRICDLFIISCMKEFKIYAQEFELKELQNIMTILAIHSELYNSYLATLSDIKFFLDFFFVKNIFSDNKIDCLDFFLRKIGPKVDDDDRTVLNEYFEKLNQAKMSTTYAKQHVESLIAAREKHWMSEEEFINFTSIDEQKIEDFLTSLKDDDVASKSNILKHYMLESEDKINEFIHVLFKCNLENESIDQKSGYLCKLLMTGEQNETKQKFIENINQFMRCRSITFSSIIKADVDEKLRNKLVNVILLNAQLYSVKIIDDKTIQGWLVPSLTSQLNLSESQNLCLLVSPKIDESENIQLKARLLNLESAMHEKLLETCSATKNDLISLEN